MQACEGFRNKKHFWPYRESKYDFSDKYPLAYELYWLRFRGIQCHLKFNLILHMVNPTWISWWHAAVSRGLFSTALCLHIHTTVQEVSSFNFQCIPCSYCRVVGREVAIYKHFAIVKIQGMPLLHMLTTKHVSLSEYFAYSVISAVCFILFERRNKVFCSFLWPFQVVAFLCPVFAIWVLYRHACLYIASCRIVNERASEIDTGMKRRKYCRKFTSLLQRKF